MNNTNKILLTVGITAVIVIGFMWNKIIPPFNFADPQPFQDVEADILKENKKIKARNGIGKVVSHSQMAKSNIDLRIKYLQNIRSAMKGSQYDVYKDFTDKDLSKLSGSDLVDVYQAINESKKYPNATKFATTDPNNYNLLHKAFQNL